MTTLSLLYGSTNKNFLLCLADFFVLDSGEVSSKKLWKMTSAAVKTDVKQEELKDQVL